MAKELAQDSTDTKTILPSEIGNEAVEVPQTPPFREVVRLGRLDPAPGAEAQVRLTEAQALAWGRASSRTLTLASGDDQVDPSGFKVEAVSGVEDGVFVIVTNPATETGLLADNDAKLILEG